MSIIKVAEHATAKYYKVIAGYDEQIIKVNNFNDYTEDQILEAYPDAKLPSYIPESHIDHLFNNPLRIFGLSIYSFGVELNPTCMSIWEYEAIVKCTPVVDPVLKMAFISQDIENGTFCINCEAYDEESPVNAKTVNKVYKWIDEHKKELENLLGLEYTIGDILY